MNSDASNHRSYNRLERERGADLGLQVRNCRRFLVISVPECERGANFQFHVCNCRRFFVISEPECERGAFLDFQVCNCGRFLAMTFDPGPSSSKKGPRLVTALGRPAVHCPAFPNLRNSTRDRARTTTPQQSQGLRPEAEVKP